MGRRKFLAALVLAVAAAYAAVYDVNEKAALGPALAVSGDDFFVAFARLEHSIKLSRYEIKGAGRQVFPRQETPLTSRTNDPLGIAVSGGTAFLAWKDHQNGKVQIAVYDVSGDKISRLTSRMTNIKPQGGVSLAYEGDRLYLGYTDGEEKVVKVATFDVGAGGKLAAASERKLADCETVVGASIAVYRGTLAVAWVNADKKIVLTTYKIEAAGPTFSFLKENRTEIKAKTEPEIDRPSLAAAEGEFYLAYVDRNDKTIHINFYQLRDDGAMKLTGEARVNERPFGVVSVAAAPAGKFFVAFTDENKNLLLSDK